VSQNFVLNANHPDRPNVLANVVRFLSALPVGKSWAIEIKQKTKTRSADQNAALFGVAEKTLGNFLGYQGDDDIKDLHRSLCGLFFGTRVDSLGFVRPIRTTTKNERGERDVISTAVAAEFYNFIQRTAAEHGCYIPDPDPFWREGK
jgi:hypothetical protein